MTKRLAIIPAIFLIIMSFFAGSLGLSELYREEGSHIINEWYLIDDLETLDLDEMGPDIMESGEVYSEAEELADIDPELFQSGTDDSGVPDSESNESEEADREALGSDGEDSEASIPEETDPEIFDESQEAYYDVEEVTPPAWSWEQVRQFLRLAHTLTPYAPTVLEELGRLHKFSVEQEAGDVPPAEPELDKALAFYRQSLVLRPAWPYGWMGIMLLKIKANQFDKDFAVAMKRAAELGPWEPGIQMGIAEDGLAIWDSLPEELRNLVLDTVDKGLEQESEYIIAVAEQYGLIEPSLEVSDDMENAAE